MRSPGLCLHPKRTDATTHKENSGSCRHRRGNCEKGPGSDTCACQGKIPDSSGSSGINGEGKAACKSTNQ
jgi:hypothetical protein